MYFEKYCLVILTNCISFYGFTVLKGMSKFLNKSKTKQT